MKLSNILENFREFNSLLKTRKLRPVKGTLTDRQKLKEIVLIININPDLLDEFSYENSETEILKSFFSKNLKGAEITQLVKKLFVDNTQPKTEEDSDNSLSFEEFENLLTDKHLEVFTDLIVGYEPQDINWLYTVLVKIDNLSALELSDMGYFEDRILTHLEEVPEESEVAEIDTIGVGGYNVDFDGPTDTVGSYTIEREDEESFGVNLKLNGSEYYFTLDVLLTGEAENRNEQFEVELSNELAEPTQVQDWWSNNWEDLTSEIEKLYFEDFEVVDENEKSTSIYEIKSAVDHATDFSVEVDVTEDGDWFWENYSDDMFRNGFDDEEDAWIDAHRTYVKNVDESEVDESEDFDDRKEYKLPQHKQKKSIPSNILSWIKEGNGYHVEDEVKQLATWHNKLTGRNFMGGTSVGKSPQTLILDITYQGGEVSVDSGRIKFQGEIIETYADYKRVFEETFRLVKS